MSTIGLAAAEVGLRTTADYRSVDGSDDTDPAGIPFRATRLPDVRRRSIGASAASPLKRSTRQPVFAL